MHPTRTSTLVFVVAGVVLFVLSESGQANGFWTSGPSWLGTIGQFGFLICVLLLVVSGLYALFSRIRKPRSPRTQRAFHLRPAAGHTPQPTR